MGFSLRPLRFDLALPRYALCLLFEKRANTEHFCRRSRNADLHLFGVDQPSNKLFPAFDNMDLILRIRLQEIAATIGEKERGRQTLHLDAKEELLSKTNQALQEWRAKEARLATVRKELAPSDLSVLRKQQESLSAAAQAAQRLVDMANADLTRAQSTLTSNIVLLQAENRRQQAQVLSQKEREINDANRSRDQALDNAVTRFRQNLNAS